MFMPIAAGFPMRSYGLCTTPLFFIRRTIHVVSFHAMKQNIEYIPYITIYNLILQFLFARNRDIHRKFNSEENSTRIQKKCLRTRQSSLNDIFLNNKWQSLLASACEQLLSSCRPFIDDAWKLTNEHLINVTFIVKHNIAFLTNCIKIQFKLCNTIVSRVNIWFGSV